MLPCSRVVEGNSRKRIWLSPAARFAYGKVTRGGQAVWSEEVYLLWEVSIIRGSMMEVPSGLIVMAADDSLMIESVGLIDPHGPQSGDLSSSVE